MGTGITKLNIEGAIWLTNSSLPIFKNWRPGAVLTLLLPRGLIQPTVFSNTLKLYLPTSKDSWIKIGKIKQYLQILVI